MVMLEPQQIHELRLALAMSFAEMAVYITKAGVPTTEATVRRWEKGERHPRWDAAKILGKLWEDAKRDGKLLQSA